MLIGISRLSYATHTLAIRLEYLNSVIAVLYDRTHSVCNFSNGFAYIYIYIYICACVWGGGGALKEKTTDNGN